MRVARLKRGTRVQLYFLNLEEAMAKIKELDFEFNQLFLSLDQSIPVIIAIKELLGFDAMAFLFTDGMRRCFRILGRCWECVGVAGETQKRSLLEDDSLCLQVAIHLFIN